MIESEGSYKGSARADGCGSLVVVVVGVGRRQGRGEAAKKEKLGPMVRLGSESMLGVEPGQVEVKGGSGWKEKGGN